MSKSIFGNDIFGKPIKQQKNGVLGEKFEFPPFTVLNARDGLWQERKRAWLSLGIRSELGRGVGLLKYSEQATIGVGGLPAPPKSYQYQQKGLGATPGGESGRTIEKRTGKFSKEGYQKFLEEKKTGKMRTGHSEMLEFARKHNMKDKIVKPEECDSSSGTSIFDPVICELVYKWFCPEGGQIIDPFAGGSVRGIIAGYMGYKYYGIDLREEQIKANEEQGKDIVPNADVKWKCGDSLYEVDNAPQADLIFSCPPYGDLEVYSDDPKDLSTMSYPDFIRTYKRIILSCVNKLKEGRMACFVIGDFRDTKTGFYRGFISDTINAFRNAGMELYNEAILITAIGSLPVRVTKTFEASRKLGKTHQNILVFIKGKYQKF